VSTSARWTSPSSPHGTTTTPAGCLAFFRRERPRPLWLHRGALDGQYANEKSGFRSVGSTRQSGKRFPDGCAIVDGNAEIDAAT
jgi:hypothetical protein